MSSPQTTRRQRRRRRDDPSTSTSTSQSPPRTTMTTTLLSRARQCLAALLSPTAWFSALSYLFFQFFVSYSQILSSETKARTDLMTIRNESADDAMDRKRILQPVPNEDYIRGHGTAMTWMDMAFMPQQMMDRVVDGSIKEEYHIPIFDPRNEGAVQTAREAAQNSRQYGEIEESQVLNAVAEADKAFTDAELASSKTDALYNITSTESLN